MNTMLYFKKFSLQIMKADIPFQYFSDYENPWDHWLSFLALLSLAATFLHAPHQASLPRQTSGEPPMLLRRW